MIERGTFTSFKEFLSFCDAEKLAVIYICVLHIDIKYSLQRESPEVEPISLLQGESVC